MNHMTIDTERCKGCGLCVAACPKHILSVSRFALNAGGYAPAHNLDPAACTACATCALVCPDVCIRVWRDEA